MIKKSLRMAGLAVMAAVGVASAHLFTDGLLPAGGETLKAGDSFTITWKEQFNHAHGTDIALSVDGGKTWTDLKKNFSDAVGTNTFKWTVAGAAATTAKIRICQNGDGTVIPCSDAENVSAPTSGANNHYVLVSKAFAIGDAAGLHSVSGEAGAFSIDFRPDSRNVDVSFGLTESKDVQLQAFDTQGRLLATLVQGAFAAGNHKLSLFSNRLDISGGSLIFKLKVGDQVKSHTWTMVR